MPDEKRQIDPKPLSPEYHRAHKQLMLWAAILFIWELVGIDLEKAREAGGNAGAIITAIRSPQAIPWVLLILVAYFLFKTSVEWYQCPQGRRALWASKVDFAAAWLVPLTGYALYVYQAIKRVQVADIVQQETGFSTWVGVGFFLGSLLTMHASSFVRRKYAETKILGGLKWSRTDLVSNGTAIATFGILAIPMVVSMRYIAGPIQWRAVFVGFLLATALLASAQLMWLLVKRIVAPLTH